MTVCPAPHASSALPLLVWLLRGAAGVALLGPAASSHEVIVTVAALVAALIVLGGCPLCWLFGLIERARGVFGPSAEGDPS